MGAQILQAVSKFFLVQQIQSAVGVMSNISDNSLQTDSANVSLVI